MTRFHMLLIAALLPLSWGFITPAYTSTKIAPLSERGTDDDCCPHDNSRQRFLSIVSFLGLNILTIVPREAHAIKEKNEALCNTGFFTNVGAW